MRCYSDLSWGSISPFSQSMSMKIGFSGNLSPDEVVMLVCSFFVLLPFSFSLSVIGRLEAGDGDRVGGNSMGMSS
jgi:hypothetical protein